MTTSIEPPNMYLSRIYDKYADARPHHPTPAHANDLLRGTEPVFRKLFLSLLPASKNASILDIGCGYGEFLYFLQREGYTNTRGIDLNLQQIEVGSAPGVRNTPCGDTRQFLADAGQSFDFISAIDLLEHIPKGRVLEPLDLV